jgi:hypothetical protein
LTVTTRKPRKDPSARKPDRQDAELLLRALEVYDTQPMRDARRWLRGLPDGLTVKEFEQRCARSSPEYDYFSSVIRYWETVGALIRRGLLHPELAFDTFLDAPPWSKYERIVKEWQREDPAEGENFEWAARQSTIWKARLKLRRGRNGERPQEA